MDKDDGLQERWPVEGAEGFAESKNQTPAAQRHEVVLANIGLTKNEIKTYLAILDSGASAAGSIAEKTKLHRPNVYDALERLEEKGLVASVLKNERRVFEATEPEHLIYLLREKETRLLSVLQKLQTVQETTRNTAVVHEGAGTFFRILMGFLENGKEILVYGMPQEGQGIIRPLIERFHRERIEKKIPFKLIFDYPAVERIAALNAMPYCEARCIPETVSPNVSTDICNDEVLLAVWTKPCLVIHLKNREIAEAHARHFAALWNSAVVSPNT